STRTGSHSYEPNGFKLWDSINEKFVVARDVIVDETNMFHSRAGKHDTKFLNDSKDVNQREFLKDSKESDHGNFPNEIKERDEIVILNDSKDVNQREFLKDGKESNHRNFPNESTECIVSKQPRQIECDENSIDCIDNNNDIEIFTRRSERLKGKQQISYSEDN
ncbi:hypothetical protein KR215_009294, partial [Drosophila sulfurigaster]